MADLNEITEGCKKQDRQSQEELYRSCYPAMMKLASRYARDIDEAASLYNEAMLKVFNNIRQYRGESNIMGWIGRIVVNTCIDHCRKQAKFSQKSLELVSEDSTSVDPEIYDKLSAGDVMGLLQDLPHNTALVFNLFVLDGFKHEEISKMLNIAVGTSKWHLNEARRLLKNKLDRALKKEIYSNAI